MRVADFLQKYAVHKDLGKVFVESAPPRSKAMVNIMVVQRGPGWNDATETYERYKETTGYDPSTGQRSLRWGFTNRDEYGQEDQVHIKDLEL